MQVQAHFQNIKETITQSLNKAEESIYTAVAWVTDSDLIGVLEKKAKENVEIYVLLVKDKINENQKLNMNKLQIAGAKIYWLSEEEQDKLMHHKFCVIDQRIVINGSFNWSRKASSKNYENISITSGSFTFAHSFIQEFERIITNHFEKDNKRKIPSLQVLLKRLEIIKTLIGIGDTDDIQSQVKKINSFIGDESIQTIFNLLNENHYGDAVLEINSGSRLKFLTV